MGFGFRVTEFMGLGFRVHPWFRPMCVCLSVPGSGSCSQTPAIAA
jgi:hypothetical protein